MYLLRRRQKHIYRHFYHNRHNQCNRELNSRTYSIIVYEDGYDFSVTPTSFSYGVGGGTKYFTIIDDANLGWYITGVPNWISLSSTAGTGGGTIAVTASNNYGGGARSGGFTVVENTYGGTTSMSVGQDSGYAFSYSPSSFSFTSGGGSSTLTISDPYSYGWTIEELPWWISVSTTAGTGNASVTVTAAANSSDARSSDFIIYEGTFGETYTIYVNQDAYVPPTPTTKNIDFTAAGTVEDADAELSIAVYVGGSKEDENTWTFYDDGGSQSENGTLDIPISTSTVSFKYTIDSLTFYSYAAHTVRARMYYGNSDTGWQTVTDGSELTLNNITYSSGQTLYLDIEIIWS